MSQTNPTKKPNFKRVYPSFTYNRFGGAGSRPAPTNNIPNAWAHANGPNQNQYHPHGPQSTSYLTKATAAPIYHQRPSSNSGHRVVDHNQQQQCQQFHKRATST